MHILDNKTREQGLIALLAITVGCVLMIAGFAVPPLGVIDNSVLIAFGEIATFVGALVGIDYNYKVKRNPDGSNKTTAPDNNA